MEIIGKAFNPAGGTERAVCTNIDGWISGLMAKGEDAGQAISASGDIACTRTAAASWALMDNEWDEHTEETVLAKTGALNYAGFIGLCITQISDSSITFRNGGDQRVLEPGKTLFYHYNDSY